MNYFDFLKIRAKNELTKAIKEQVLFLMNDKRLIKEIKSKKEELTTPLYTATHYFEMHGFDVMGMMVGNIYLVNMYKDLLHYNNNDSEFNEDEFLVDLVFNEFEAQLIDALRKVGE